MGRENAPADNQIRPILRQSLAKGPPDSTGLDMGSSKVQDGQCLVPLGQRNPNQEVTKPTEEMGEVFLPNQALGFTAQKGQGIGSERVRHSGSSHLLDRLGFARGPVLGANRPHGEEEGRNGNENVAAHLSGHRMRGVAGEWRRTGGASSRSSPGSVLRVPTA